MNHFRRNAVLRRLFVSICVTHLKQKKIRVIVTSDYNISGNRHVSACMTVSKAERCYINMEINVEKLNDLPEGSYQLIDMRSDPDFEYGTIPGAIHISQEDLQGHPQIIKSKKVILILRHGTNSIEAAEELEAGRLPCLQPGRWLYCMAARRDAQAGSGRY